MKNIFITLLGLFCSLSNLAAEDSGKHLFILSGQSNMQGHKPQEAFTPAIEKEFGKENVIIVQDAQGGQPLYRWAKDWKTPQGEKPKQSGDLYDRLMGKVKPAIKGQKIKTVTFLWMQGERDARMQWGSLYEAGFLSLLQQLETDLGHKDINFVIGRLSDFGNSNKAYKDWNKMRKVLEKLADDSPRGAWVDTDDLNDGVNRGGKKIKNDLHYSAEGYKTLGKRFAAKAIELVKKSE
ncbi:hypothetical protein NT6N_13300 [Oceaniferula spumae]|uniref:Sialate O-acetylesterase domain-containing protein n=1 Tax=Oceaniferula spumae TaxID=2979115 RepID=A0AAT9FJX9_9BACT